MVPVGLSDIIILMDFQRKAFTLILKVNRMMPLLSHLLAISSEK